MKIRLLKHKEIDKHKWNECINRATNGLIYAFSWYLDVVSPGWEALVADDYVCVMPLPVKRKWGIKYVLQPFLTQQLGIFSEEETSADCISHFVRKIPYVSYELHLNENNIYPQAAEQPNFVLDTNHPYEWLQRHFSKNTHRNIAAATNNGLRIVNGLTISDFRTFYFETETHYAKSDKKITTELLTVLSENGAVKIYGAMNSNNRLVAAACFVVWRRRIINLLPISSAQGKAFSAMFLIVNEVINSCANSAILLDFEGSRIAGVARFYKGFGAKQVNYYRIKRCRPSFLIGKL